MLKSTLVIGDYFDPPVFHDGNTRVCSPKIYPNDWFVWLDGCTIAWIRAGAGAGKGEDGKGAEEDKKENEDTISNS